VAVKTSPIFSAEDYGSTAGVTKTVAPYRSRVNFFLNKFKKLGFIDDDGHAG
jgi:hypothetical protein